MINFVFRSAVFGYSDDGDSETTYGKDWDKKFSIFALGYSELVIRQVSSQNTSCSGVGHQFCDCRCGAAFSAAPGRRAGTAEHFAGHATKPNVDDAVENEVGGKVDQKQTVCDDRGRLVDEIRGR